LFPFGLARFQIFWFGFGQKEYFQFSFKTARFGSNFKIISKQLIECPMINEKFTTWHTFCELIQTQIWQTLF